MLREYFSTTDENDDNNNNNPSEVLIMRGRARIFLHRCFIISNGLLLLETSKYSINSHFLDLPEGK